jgi:formylglycine-generating enzyme required for sulfatase activity
VTLDEWRDELAQLSTTFTREGNHYWRYVPGGTYTIGGWLDDDDEENDGQADIALPDYWVAKYPITVQQYRQFIDAGGYANQQYWTPSGWDWKVNKNRTQPLYWGNDRFMADNQPVVSIYWYEAVAYANWLQSELGDTLPEGTCLRLPTEAEWEVTCAYGADGQRYSYPWGNDEPTSSLADYGRSIETDNPLPVGMHPDGAAPSGVQDIVGGVWDLLSTGFDVYPEASDVVVDDFTSETWNPSTRGAAWYSGSRHVRCGSRDDDPTDNAPLFYEGIRVVISDCE